MTYVIARKDLKIETFRASGNGGQNVNKVESAVRITHLPTGLSAQSQDQRDQHANKKIALDTLLKRIKARLVREALDRRNALRAGQFAGRVRTYDLQASLVVDHLSGKRTTRVKDVLDGHLELLR